MNPTIIAFPAVANPSKIDWSLERYDARATSPLTGGFQDIVRPGATWMTQLTWSTLSYDDSQGIAAWAAQMSRGNVRTMLPNFAYKARGSLSGTPKVNGGSQTGFALATKGWTASASNVLRTGDLFQIGYGSITFNTAPGNTYPIVFVDINGNTVNIGTGDGSTATFNLDTAYYLGAVVKVNGTPTTAFTSTMTHQLVMVTADTSADGSGNATIPIEPSLRLSPADGNTIITSNPPAFFAFSKPSSMFSYLPPRIATLSLALMEDIQL